MPATSSHPVRIVIAEDSRIQAKILQKHLAGAGHQVRVAQNGAEAWQMIQQDPPTIIISDIEMPEMNGYQLCERVKSDPALRRIPLILLSTLSQPEDIVEGLRVGADNYVTKPYNADYLLARVESLLQTPVAAAETEGPALEVTLAGKRHTVRSSRQQVLNLLISTFENAVEKNNELIRVNEELSRAKEQLTRQNDDLQQLNQKLETTNARMADSLAAAAKVQHSLLPGADAEVTGAELAWRYIPCDELAGDFLNFFPLDDSHIALFVVDVSGHGVASSLLAVTIGRMLTPHASVSSLLVRQSAAGERPCIVPPAEVLAELNSRLPMEGQGGLYFTVLYAIFDTKTRELRFASGGHTPLVAVAADGSLNCHDADGIAVGWMDDMEFEEVTLQLAPGDRVFLYSDGVSEAMDADLNEFGEERMLGEMKRHRERPLDEAVGELLKAILNWCGRTGPKDDVSILALEVPR